MVAAAYDPSKGRSPVIGAAGSTNEPVERRLQAGEPSGLEKPGVERIMIANVVAAPADDRTVVPPVAAQRIENLASDAKNPWQVEGALEVRWSSEATHSDSDCSDHERTEQRSITKMRHHHRRRPARPDQPLTEPTILSLSVLLGPSCT